MHQQQIEEWVVQVLRDLGLAVTGADDDFFAVGGTSLTAMRFIARVEERYGEGSLPPDDLYERSSVREIAASVRSNTSVGASSDGSAAVPAVGE